MTLTEAQRQQRLNNVAKIAERKRTAERCRRGHSNWGVWKLPNGRTRRVCKTCKADTDYYRKRGLDKPPDR